MKQFFENNKKQILISLTIGIFLFYFKPVLSWISDKVILLLLAANNSFAESYYKSLATNNPYNLAVQNNTILISIFIYLCMLIWMHLDTLHSAAKREFFRLIKQVKEIKEDMEHSKKPITKENALAEINRIESELESQKKEYEKPDKFFLIFHTTWILLAIIFLSRLLVEVSVKEENINFSNRILLLETKMEDKEIKILKAEWTQIRSKGDYDIVQKEVEDSLSKYQIKVK